MKPMRRSNPSKRLNACFDFRQNISASRRSFLQAGALGALGLNMANMNQIVSAQGSSADGSSIRPKPAKACIFLFMWGGPSQLDTFDLKPNAPSEVRGPFKPIPTRVPGMEICEHFVELAKNTDKIALIRSLTHDDPAHLSSGHLTVTGKLAPVLKSDATPPSDKDSPHIGSLLAKLQPPNNGLPPFVTLPWKAYHPAAPGGEAPGQHGGYLGAAYDSFLVGGDPNAPDWKPATFSLPAEMSLGRLESRYNLLRSFDRFRAEADVAAQITDLRSHQIKAYEMLTSPNVRNAFDLGLEPTATRERYGRNIHGQGVLLARRLIEHGVPMVSVNWHNDGKNFWDTHGDNFNRLKNDLIPPADRALAALLEDLDERGMLDETLVVWVGEFGRRPTITPENSGREHWPFCYSGLMAGGGIRGGMIYGSSDSKGAYPDRDPVTPQDLGTTIVHALGIPTDATVQDREGRPHHVATGKVISELFA